MRKVILFILSIIVIFSVHAEISYTVNKSIEEIPLQERTKLLQSSDTCLNSFIHGDFEQMKSFLTMSAEELEYARFGMDYFLQQQKEYGSFNNFSVRDIKMVTLKKSIKDGEVLQTVTSWKGKEVPVRMIAFNFPRQAIVLYNVYYERETVVFTLIYFYENGKWILKILDQKLITYYKKDFYYYWSLAEKEREKGNILLSFLFYQITADLFNISPYYRYEDLYVKLGEETGFLEHEDVCFKKSIQWLLASGEIITVFLERYFFLMEVFYFHIFYVGKDFQNQDIVTREAKAIVEYVKKNHPDLQTFFKGIFISSYQSVPKDKEEESSTVKVDWNGKVTIVDMSGVKRED